MSARGSIGDGPEGAGEPCPSYGAELERVQAAGFELVRCCDGGCWRCYGHGWVLPARATAKRWDDGGASDEAAARQVELPL